MATPRRQHSAKLRYLQYPFGHWAYILKFHCKGEFPVIFSYPFYLPMASFVQFPEHLNPNPASVAICVCSARLLLDFTSLLGLRGEELVGKGPCSQDKLEQGEDKGPEQEELVRSNDPCRLCAKLQVRSVLQRHTGSFTLSPDRSQLTPFPCLCQTKKTGIAERRASGESLKGKATAIQ